ncbi:phosphate ABC transporter substrate-binding protein [Cloacibacillus evryensis]|uniref:Phosphate-binding protein n=1 Tax=Cloacibacillus evryensis TaxID=508460 RepID=A0AAW5JYR0_9BACT|nr:phosphate ABC transporter substrate-binding protein [Cloacibacillus evryensis]EHL71505.1 phosphate binding protein [Synergistes sp. 3_1_syn1]EXG77929.1 phosphate binding protein [Cloacibacillus evryensis DSM 19522]MCQ4813680.1 phosphate ABC transporter substrate-binding protein [Cloacibacillus evryensis]MEA5034169.1 phosphate ABC transporter substrate-binding protein [Cloacibacillus evryensis]
MKKFLIAAVICLFAATAFAASPLDVFKGRKGKIDIAGGTAHIPVMKEAAKRIMGVNPDIRITVAGGGSGVGVKQVGEGLVEIGNTGRPLKKDEVEKYGLETFPFAIDGVAVVVNPANKVAELSFEQLIDIYAGKITNWKAVGGDDAEINLYVREDGSGTREVFTDKAIKKGDVSAKANVVNSNGAMKTAVAKDARAIGYVGIGHIDSSVKAPKLAGMTATQENAASGKYTVVRDLFMNTKGKPAGLTALFIDYIYSPEGAQIIKDSGYIPLPRK